MEETLFYIFSGAMLFFGLLVITNRNPVNSAIFLVLVLFLMAGLFVLLHAFFLAAIQVLVYAGAVMVLFLFVIMLLNVKEETKSKSPWFGIFGSALVMAALILEFFVLLRDAIPHLLLHQKDASGTTEAVGKLLFSEYLLPFEVISILLLAAMIGVVVLSQKEKHL